MQEKLKRHIEALVPLAEDEFALVHSLFTAKRFLKNQFIFKEGDKVKDIYFVVSGLLKLNYTDDTGKVCIVSFAMEEWWESDFQAYFNQTAATMSLQCIEDTDVLCISLENYFRMCHEIPVMKDFLVHKSNAGFIASQQRILSLLTNNAQKRYDKLLNQYPSLFQRVPKSQLALYLGVSRETLSRLSS